MKHGAKHIPKFSILLPTHNRADILPFAIRSVLAQTLQDFELLIVGDGCTDQTAEVVGSFSDNRISWFNLPKAPNFGYANRNIALRQARGTYIAMMAHDDLWLPDHLELLHLFLQKPGIELAYSRPLWVIPEGMIAPGTFDLEHAPTLKSFLAKEQNWIPAGCVVHTRECFAKYGYWNDALPSAGDLDMWTRIILGGEEKNFAYLAEPTCLHFRADWRGEITPDLYPLNVWKQFHALEGFMPAVLKIPVAAGRSEQEAVWQAISSDPPGWSKQVRAAIRQILDQRVSQSNHFLGWLLMREPSLQSDAASLIERIAELFRRQASLEQHIANLEQHIIANLEQHAANLEQHAANLEQQIANLTEEKRVANLLTESLNKRIAELLESKANLQQHVAGLNKHIEELSERQASLEQYVASLSETLIPGSVMWKFVRGLRTIKRRIIPPGSTREKLWLHFEQNLRRVV